MTAGDYSNYENRYEDRVRAYRSEDSYARERAEEERAAELSRAAARTRTEAPRERAKPMAAAPQRTIQPSLAQNEIKEPPKSATTLHVVLVDNSGSNRTISRALRNGAGYLHAMLKIFAPTSSIAFIFFSDHKDDDGLMQQVNYTLPSQKGAEVLLASIANVRDADGADAPEAIECVLRAAARLPFGEVPKGRRCLYLVSDQVAHGMSQGRQHDDGCPEQCDWRLSLEEVHEAYGAFRVVASGDDSRILQLQKQFIAPERWRYDLLDLATGLSHDERCRLVTNALLFFIARQSGAQTVEGFLMTLVEKWMQDPQYGANTARNARRQITAFAEYLEIDEPARKKLLEKVFAGLPE